MVFKDGSFDSKIMPKFSEPKEIMSKQIVGNVGLLNICHHLCKLVGTLCQLLETLKE
jgi:hypothetical protein